MSIPSWRIRGRTFINELGKNVGFRGTVTYSNINQVLTVEIRQSDRLFNAQAMWNGRLDTEPRWLVHDGTFPESDDYSMSGINELLLCTSMTADNDIILRFDCDAKPEFWLEVTLTSHQLTELSL